MSDQRTERKPRPGNTVYVRLKRHAGEAGLTLVRLRRARSHPDDKLMILARGSVIIRATRDPQDVEAYLKAVRAGEIVADEVPDWQATLSGTSD